MSRIKIISISLVVLTAILVSEAVWADTPFPEIKIGKKVYVVGVPDVYDDVLPQIEKYERATYGDRKLDLNLDYLVVIVKDAGGNAQEYGDRLYEKWIGSDLIDPDRHILITVGIDDREISVHPGVELQTLGFSGSAIDSQVVQPVFIPQARSGNIERGLVLLIDGIFNWIGNAEETIIIAQEEQRRTYEKRSEEVRDLLDETDALIRTKREEGLIFEVPASFLDVERRITDSQATIDELERIAFSLQEVGDSVAEAEELRERAKSGVAEVKKESERIEALFKDNSDLQLDEAKGYYDQAHSKLEEAIANLDEDYNSSIKSSNDAMWYLRLAQDGVNTKRRNRLAMNILKISILIIALAILGVIYLILLRRHNREKKEASDKIQQWDTDLKNASQRFLHLQEEYKWFPFSTPGESKEFTGVTQEIYTQVGEKVDEIVLKLDRADQLLSSARELFEKQSFVGIGNYRKIMEMLTEEEIVIDTEDASASYDLFSPLKREIKSSAQELLGMMGDLYKQVREDLDKISSAGRESGEQFVEIEKLRDDLNEHIKEAEGKGLNTDGFEEWIGEVDVEVMEAKELESDPVGTLERAIAVRETLAERTSIVKSALEQIEILKPLQVEVKDLSDRVVQLRGQGLMLDEEGWKPDRLLVYSQAKLEAGKSLLECGQIEEAEEDLEEAQGSYKEALFRVDRTLEAAEKVEGEIARVEEGFKKLEPRSRDMLDLLQDLKDKYALDSFLAEINNDDEVLMNLKDLIRIIEGAKSESDKEVQNYITAMAMVERADEMINLTSRLIAEVSQKLTELEQKAQDSQRRFEEIGKKIDDLDSYIQEHSFEVSEEIEGLAAPLRDKLQEIPRYMQVKRPDWEEVERYLDEVEEDIEEVRAEAQAEIDSFDKLKGMLPQAQARVQNVIAFLNSEGGDTEAENNLALNAQAIISEAVRLFGQPRSSWDIIIESVLEAMMALDKAEKMAKESIALEEKARREIREAENIILKADVRYKHRIRADLRGARGKLRDARKALISSTIEGYKKAILLANEAERYANEAKGRALAEVRAQDRRIEQRRREEARRKERARISSRRASSIFKSSSSSSSWRSSSSSSRSSWSSSSSGSSRSSW